MRGSWSFDIECGRLQRGKLYYLPRSFLKEGRLMTNVIVNKLKEIEQTENVRILMAVESGSRAWGFASPDSDYDVRFIYVRTKEDYLRLNKPRDVIELPIDDVLDINGWDLDKALKLLYRSNPGLFEWFSSPIVYLGSDFCDSFRPLLNSYFSPQKGLYHYLSMAYNNDREFLKGDVVKAKKYFYVLRPVLACRWIMDKNSPPPVLFGDLAEAELDPSLQPVIDKLLDIKMNQPELKLIPRIDVLNDYLDRSIREVEDRISAMPDRDTRSWDDLNRFFLNEIGM